MFVLSVVVVLRLFLLVLLLLLLVGVVWCGPAVVAVMLNSDGVGIDMRSVQFSSALPETTSCTAIRIFPYPLQHDSPSSSRPFASPLARAALAGVAFAVATLPFTNFRMAAGRLEGARKMSPGV